jgi:hypothetical protein
MTNNFLREITVESVDAALAAERGGLPHTALTASPRKSNPPPSNHSGPIPQHRPSKPHWTLRLPTFVSALASQSITTAAASRIPIPTRLRCASRYPIKLKTEVITTKPANAVSGELIGRRETIEAAKRGETENAKTG